MSFDPSLMWVVSGSRRLQWEDADLRALQRRYANLWLQHWGSMYELGVISETVVRIDLRRTLFSGDVGREYWAGARSSHDYRRTYRARRYDEIVYDEYEKAVSAGPPEKVRLGSPPSDTMPEISSPAFRRGVIGLSAAAGLVGAVLAIVAVKKSAGRP